MNIFNIDWKKFRNEILPVRLRKPRLLAYLKMLISPVVFLYGLFRKNREKSLYKVNHRQHIVHVEAVLNDRFDSGFRRIRILDAPEGFEPFEVFQNVENKPIHFYQDTETEEPTYLWDYDESEYGGVDFVVEVPVSLPYNLAEMTALLNEYKTPGAAVIIQEV